MAKRVGIYARVSTRNGQTTENQLRELRSVANQHGWEVIEVFTDDGVSGAKGRDQRPGLDELLKGVARREFDVVAAWSVDRLRLDRRRRRRHQHLYKFRVVMQLYPSTCAHI